MCLFQAKPHEWILNIINIYYLVCFYSQTLPTQHVREIKYKRVYGNKIKTNILFMEFTRYCFVLSTQNRNSQINNIFFLKRAMTSSHIWWPSVPVLNANRVDHRHFFGEMHVTEAIAICIWYNSQTNKPSPHLSLSRTPNEND